MSCWSNFRVWDRQAKDHKNSRHITLRSTTNATAVAVSHRLAAFVPSTDQEHHSVQWYRAIRHRFDQLPPKTAQALLDLCDNDDLGSSMTYLEGQYQKSVVSSGIRAIESILVRIDGFERALTTFVQAGPLPVQVLWGSTQLLINMAIRHEKVLDSIMQMIEHLTDTMPRFETYLNLYPTPALRKAMRAIYDDMIDFILTSVIFLSRRRYDNMLRLLWSKLDKNYDNMKQASET